MSFRRRMMMAVNSKPYDTEIEYLESTGTQYIDTLISRGDSFESSEYIIDLQFTNISGRQIQGSGTGFYCGVNNNRWETDYNQYHGAADLNRHIYSKKYQKTNNESYFYTYLDNVLKYSWNSTYSDNHFVSTICLFGMSVNSTTKCKEKIFSAKIYLNNVLVRDFIPVRVGQVGYMYDKVSGQLFGNSGTGNFILGEDLPYDAEIEYLESTGNGEYINLGISPSSDIIFTYNALYPSIGSTNLVEGCIESSGSTYKRFHIGANTTNFEGGIGTLYGRISNANTNRHTFQISGKVNRAYCDSYFYEGNSNYPSIPIYLFCRNFNGTASNSHRVRIFNAHIYSYSQSKKLIDLIPVKKNGIGYMYDKVSGQLFGNSGTGNFILGNDK